MKTLLNNQIETRLNSANYKITTSWLVGFIEAEGHFSGKVGEQAAFHLSQHASDWTLIEAIAKFIGHGKVNLQVRSDGRAQAVLSIYHKDVLKNVIIPLCSGNFRSLKKVIQFNEWLEVHFPDIKGLTKTIELIHPDWLVGFVDGDGSFYSIIHTAKDYKCGYQVQAVFDIAQLDLERELLQTISSQFFNSVHKWAKSGSTQHLRIINLSDLVKYVEPFFVVNPLKTRKQLDFIIWREILRIIQAKEHLTLEGVEAIRRLRDLQNEYRLKLSEIVQIRVNSKF